MLPPPTSEDIRTKIISIKWKPFPTEKYIPMIDLGDKGHYTFLYQRNLSAWQLQIEKQLKLNEVGFK